MTMLNAANTPETTTAAAGVCWSCSAPLKEGALFCEQCGKIQPPSGGYFSVFGLTPRLNLDLGMLEHQFHKLSRKLHPDRFGRASAQEKEWSLAGSSLLNDAYRTLKDPIARTRHLLRMHGAEIGEEFAGKDKKDPSRVPADLLEEVFELNMQLEELRMERKMGEVDEQLHADLKQAEKKFLELQDEVDEQLRAQWTAWDEGDETARETAQKTMVALLDRRRYLSNLVREVTETLGDS
jgi:molecular chaperone HscB